MDKLLHQAIFFLGEAEYERRFAEQRAEQLEQLNQAQSNHIEKLHALRDDFAAQVARFETKLEAAVKKPKKQAKKTKTNKTETEGREME